MRVSKALLFSVLHARHTGVPAMLGQELPAEFDTANYPGLLDGLGLQESDLTGVAAAEAVELTRMDAGPHGQFQDSWQAHDARERRTELADDLAPLADPRPRQDPLGPAPEDQ